MDSSCAQALLRDSTCLLFFDRLRGLFAAMDREYALAADHYGFLCRGCPDNCCQTHFHHHTWLEYLFVLAGFNRLATQEKQEIASRAEQVRRRAAQADQEGKALRSMCPLNDHGLCGLYPYRPMICRLHGIPHEFQKPGGTVDYSPGCATFDECCSAKPYFRFDRTPFYLKMANLEKEFKQAAGLTGRIKVTIAEMIVGGGR